MSSYRVVGICKLALFATVIPVNGAEAANNSSRNNVAQVEGGTVIGVTSANSEVRVFKGIPYAAPPTGNLRWRPPQSVAPWKGVRRADTFSPACTQPALSPTDFYYQGQYPTSEDCLYLNIWTSAKSSNERRPVLLWIHDGALAYGRGSRAAYDGESLSKKGLVVVTINYRLGIVGTLAHPELSRESSNNVSGNYALLDMIAAIKWTRRNIAAFGGDPARITLYGESLGGRAVTALSISPLVKGDIRAVIAGDTIWGGGPKLADAERRGEDFVRAINEGPVEDLRRIPADQLLKYNEFGGEFVVDGWALTEKNLLAAQESGAQHDIPILTGVTADFASAILSPVSAQEFVAQSRERFGAFAERFLTLYPSASDAEAAESQRACWTDQVMWMHAEWAAAHAGTGHQSYFYFFTHSIPPPPGAKTIFRSDALLPQRLGAYHTGEIAYAFDSLSKMGWAWTAADYRLADVMSSYWVNFVASGNPNGSGLPTWPAYGSTGKPVMELGDEVRAIPATLDKEKLKFWADYSATMTER